MAILEPWEQTLPQAKSPTSRGTHLVLQPPPSPRSTCVDCECAPQRVLLVNVVGHLPPGSTCVDLEYTPPWVLLVV
jgi:hypothetical protein